VIATLATAGTTLAAAVVAIPATIIAVATNRPYF
jgi:hypothetical protein